MPSPKLASPLAPTQTAVVARIRRSYLLKNHGAMQQVDDMFTLLQHRLNTVNE